MLRYTYTSGSLYCCTSGHVTLSKITLSHHGVGVDIITVDISVLFALLQQRYTTRNRFSQLRFFPFGSLNKSNYKFMST